MRGHRLQWWRQRSAENLSYSWVVPCIFYIWWGTKWFWGFLKTNSLQVHDIENSLSLTLPNLPHVIRNENLRKLFLISFLTGYFFSYTATAFTGHIKKFVHERTYNFLEKYNCLYKYQYGFRKSHPTRHALIEITEKIRKALDSPKFAYSIFVDLQKAHC